LEKGNKSSSSAAILTSSSPAVALKSSSPAATGRGSMDSPPTAAGNDGQGALGDDSKKESLLTAPPVPPSPAPDADPPTPATQLARPRLPSGGRPSAGPDVWKRFLAELWKKPSVASQMERAHLKSATASEWVIGFLDAFAMASVQRNQGFLEETAAALAGGPVAMRFVQDAQERRKGEEATVVVPPPAGQRPSGLDVAGGEIVP